MNNNNGLQQVIFGILLPVLILNKGSHYTTPLIALLVALCFPIGLGIFEFVKHKKTSFISLLGLLNILVTGTLAVLNLGGIWFSIKEAAFPLLIGAFVFISSFTKSPFFGSLILNPAIMDIEKVQGRISEKNNHLDFAKLLKNCNFVVSGSFLISALLNFIIAKEVFIPIETGLTSDSQKQILNEQIAQMTYKAMISVAIPSFIIILILFYYFMAQLRKLTDLTLEEIIKN
jgi:hypothetical protein